MIFKEMLKNKQAVIDLSMILTVTVVMIFAPLLAINNPIQGDLADRFSENSDKYPLGTDQLGRCIYSRLIYGSRYSLGIALPVLVLASMISLITGTIAAYYGGLIDRIFVGICDIVMAFPPMIVVLTLVGSYGQGISSLIMAIILAIWVWNAKIVRSYVLIERNKMYIIASKVAGCSDFKIILRHIIPNILPPLIVFYSLSVGEIIIMISSFSFLGLGVETSTPEWGAMINEARKFTYSRPYFVLYPGFCIFFTAVGFNLLGEALKDIVSSGYGEYRK